MKEILITSSVLIAVVLLLRWVFRGRVSHRLIYGAWLLVAVRLLVPVQLGSFDFSILSRTEPVTNAMEQAANTPVAGQSREEIRQEVELEYFIRGEDLMPQIQAILEQEKLRNPDIDSQWEQLYEEIVQEKPVEQVFTQKAQTQIEQAVQQRAAAPTIGQIAVGVWLAGTAVMGVWFLWVNISFGAKLRRSGEPVEGVEAEVPVRMSRAISSPCLFGLWRPVIWLTPQCMESEARLRHVLAHERTHRKHLDHIWSLVRCVCLCVYWFNPLVWVAASLSKRDCELACDEAALKKLGDSERVAYGKTLVDLVASNISAGQLLETATAMHETKKQLKTRVGYIVKKPKVLLTAVVVLVLLLAVVTGCSFAGQQETQPELNVPETTESTEETESTKATEPKPTETQPAPTQPVETQPRPTGLEVLPEIPKMDTLQEKPDNMTAEDFVVTVYDKYIAWNVFFKLPALLPVSQDAIAVNEEIRIFYEDYLSTVREKYDNNQKIGSSIVRYEVIVGEKKLVTVHIMHGGTNDRWYIFDIQTGTRLTSIEVFRRISGANIEYPEYLRALSARLIEEQESVSGENLLYSTVYAGENGGYVAAKPYTATKSITVQSVLSAGRGITEEYAYRWMFGMAAENRAAAWTSILVNAFIDAPRKFLHYYIEEESFVRERIDTHLQKNISAAEAVFMQETCKVILSDSSNGILIRYAAFNLVEDSLLDDEYTKTVEMLYEAASEEVDGSHHLIREVSMLIAERLPYEGRKKFRELELNNRTEVIDATWKVCYVANPDGVGIGSQWGTHADVITDYEQFLKEVKWWTEGIKEYGFRSDLTNSQCPESLDDVCASITEAFFEENVLIWVSHIDVKSVVPKVTKVDYDSNAFWNNPYQVHMECADTHESGNMVEYQILVAIPKEQYREFPENYEELFWHSVWENASCVLNGNPYVKMDY